MNLTYLSNMRKISFRGLLSLFMNYTPFPRRRLLDSLVVMYHRSLSSGCPLPACSQLIRHDENLCSGVELAHA